MKDKFFVDTNILIYSICKNSKKCKIGRDLLIEKVNNIIISSQIIYEFIAVSIKNFLPIEDIFYFANNFMDIFDFVLITKETIEKAFDIKEKYKYSYWDSLVISSSLESDCSILYTEDMQHGQIIEGKLKIVNPFY